MLLPLVTTLTLLKAVLFGLLALSFLIVGIVALIGALGPKIYAKWPLVDGKVVGSTKTPQFVDGNAVAGQNYLVVEYPDATGQLVQQPVKPPVLKDKPAGTQVKVHVDPTGQSTAWMPTSLLLRAGVGIGLGVVFLALAVSAFL